MFARFLVWLSPDVILPLWVVSAAIVYMLPQQSDSQFKFVCVRESDAVVFADWCACCRDVYNYEMVP
jgi:hemolysin-activating ACP:hemolysin acyltransferase